MENHKKQIWLRELLRKNAPIVYKKYALYKIAKEIKNRGSAPLPKPVVSEQKGLTMQNANSTQPDALNHS